MKGWVEILKIRLEINFLLRIIEACSGREISVEEKSRNRYLKHVWKWNAGVFRNFRLKSVQCFEKYNSKQACWGQQDENDLVCLRRESKWYIRLPWELVLGTFLNLCELTCHGCSHLAVLCGCVVPVFTGSGDACARAFNSRSGVLQKIFRGHKFIINCIQVRKGFLGGLSSLWLLPHLFCGNWCGWLFCVSWIGCWSRVRLEYSVCNFRKAC